MFALLNIESLKFGHRRAARPIASRCEKRCRLEAGLPNARTMQGVYGWSLESGDQVGRLILRLL